MHNQRNRDLWHNCKRNKKPNNKLHLNVSRRTLHTSCDKTCDQSHTVEVEDLGPDLEEDIEFQNSYTDDDKPNLGKSDQPTSSEEDDGSWI